MKIDAQGRALPLQAQEASSEAHRLDNAHHHHHHHRTGHRNGHVYRVVRPLRPPVAQRAQRRAPHRGAPTLQGSSDEHDHVPLGLDALPQDDELRSFRVPTMRDSSSDLDFSGDDYDGHRKRAYQQLLMQLRAPRERPPRDPEAELAALASPAIDRLQSAARGQPGIDAESCAQAIVAALASTQDPALRLTLLDEYARGHPEPSRFASLSQVREALVQASLAGRLPPAGPADERTQNQRLLLPLALLSLGHDRDPAQAAAAQARRANSARSMQALAPTVLGRTR